MAQFNSRIEVVNEFRSKLTTNKTWTLHGLVTLFNNQTEDEQEVEHTRYSNGLGFNHSDAKTLTSIAKWYIQKGFVTDNQLALVQSKIGKYANQLVSHGIRIGKIKKDGNSYIF